MLFQVADFTAQFRKLVGNISIDAGFVSNDFGLDVVRRIIKFDGYETLPSAVLQVLQRALVAGVVGEHQQEPFSSFEQFTFLFHRQYPAVVGQWVNQDCRVLAGLDDLVQVADATGFDCPCEGAINPNGLVAFEEVSTNEVAGGQVLMARDGDKGHDVVVRTNGLWSPWRWVLFHPGQRLAETI
jgi:hypothetical protein